MEIAITDNQSVIQLYNYVDIFKYINVAFIEQIVNYTTIKN